MVFDPQGGVLAGATVVAVHAASGQRFERVSDDRGRFFLPALPVGEYVLSVALEGFTQTTERGVVLLVGQKVSVRVVLQLGERTETVTVTAVSPFLQTTTSEVADVISNRQVVQLPLNGRQFLQLAQLSDGVVIPPGGTRGAALEQAGALARRAGPAQRPQHLSARRRQGHRRVLQQPGHHARRSMRFRNSRSRRRCTRRSSAGRRRPSSTS